MIRKSNNVLFFQETVEEPLVQHTNLRLVTVQISSVYDTVLVVVV